MNGPLLLPLRILRAKSSYSNRNLCDWEFRVRAEKFCSCCVNSPRWPTESCLFWKLILCERLFIHLTAIDNGPLCSCDRTLFIHHIVSIMNRNFCYLSFVCIQGVGTSFRWVWRELCECLRREREDPKSIAVHRVPVPYPHAECMMSLVLQALYMYWYWKPCLIY